MPSVELSKPSALGAPRAVSPGDRTQVEARARLAPPAAPAAPGISLEVGATAAAATPPVDAERVAQIRDALRDGSYPLVPTRIADAMIAAQVSLALPDRD